MKPTVTGAGKNKMISLIYQSWGEYSRALPPLLDDSGKKLSTLETARLLLPNGTPEEIVHIVGQLEHLGYRKKFNSATAPLVIRLLQMKGRPPSEIVAVLLKYGPPKAVKDILVAAGSLIKALREQKHIRKEDLAAKVKLSARKISALEQGNGADLELLGVLLEELEAGEPSWEMMREICRQEIPGHSGVESNAPLPEAFKRLEYPTAFDDEAIIRKVVPGYVAADTPTTNASPPEEGFVPYPEEIVIVHDELPDEAFPPSLFKRLVLERWDDLADSYAEICEKQAERWWKIQPEGPHDEIQWSTGGGIDPRLSKTKIYIDHGLITRLMQSKNSKAIKVIGLLLALSRAPGVIMKVGTYNGIENRRFERSCENEPFKEVPFSASSRANSKKHPKQDANFWLRELGMTGNLRSDIEASIIIQNAGLRLALGSPDRPQRPAAPPGRSSSTESRPSSVVPPQIICKSPKM